MNTPSYTHISSIAIVALLVAWSGQATVQAAMHAVATPERPLAQTEPVPLDRETPPDTRPLGEDEVHATTLENQPRPGRDTELQTQQQARQAERQNRIRAHRQELEAQLAQRLEERHQQLSLRIADTVNQLNERFTNHYLRHLDLLSQILAKIVSRSELLALEPSAAQSITDAVAVANQIFDDLRLIIEVQQDTVYTVDLQPDQPVGQALSEAILQLMQDHEILRLQLITARSAVQDIFHLLRTLADAGREPTSLEPTPADEDTAEEFQDEEDVFIDDQF